MRFRADISNTTQLTRLITSLAPLSKVATLKLKADAIHLICQGERGGVQVWRIVETILFHLSEEELTTSFVSSSLDSVRSLW